MTVSPAIVRAYINDITGSKVAPARSDTAPFPFLPFLHRASIIPPWTSITSASIGNTPQEKASTFPLFTLDCVRIYTHESSFVIIPPLLSIACIEALYGGLDGEHVGCLVGLVWWLEESKMGREWLHSGWVVGIDAYMTLFECVRGRVV